MHKLAARHVDVKAECQIVGEPYMRLVVGVLLGEDLEPVGLGAGQQAVASERPGAVRVPGARLDREVGRATAGVKVVADAQVEEPPVPHGSPLRSRWASAMMLASPGRRSR